MAAPQAWEWPVCAVEIRDDASALVTVNGVSSIVQGVTLDAARRDAVRIVAHTATGLGRPVVCTITDSGQTFRATVSPDRQVVTLPDGAVTPAAAAATGPNRADRASPVGPVTAPPGGPPPPRRSFTDLDGAPPLAEDGWRGWAVARGLRVQPGRVELQDRAWRTAVAQHWPGPKTVAVVNGKGGAGKTPTTICLSAVFARYGGAGVLAWDNNQTRGTLGWRTERAGHDATLLDLLPQANDLLEASARTADLSRFVHHQSADMFDVLRSNSQLLANEQRISAADVDAIWRVASKYYRLIVVDSGNDESDPVWRRMIDHTDQLVVPTTTRGDHAEAGALLLEALRDRNEAGARLAARAVVIITQADPKASSQEIQLVAQGYAPLARAVVVVPYDAGMVNGPLQFNNLRPSTRRAWLAAAAAVAQGLAG